MSVKLNSTNFDQVISNGLAVVDFYAEWCGPCRALAPILEQLTGATIGKVNGDVSPEIVGKYNVSAYPTVIFFKNGVEVDRLVGLSNKQKLQMMIDALN